MIVGNNAIINQFVPQFQISNICDGQTLVYDSNRRSFVNVAPETASSTITKLGQLVDVSPTVDNLFSLENGQALVYNSTTNLWQNSFVNYNTLLNIPTSANYSFIGLNDVTPTALANGYVLWNSSGTELIYSTTIPSTSVSGLATVARTGSFNDLINKPTSANYSFIGLNDVTPTALANGYVLWNSSGTELIYSTTISATKISGLASVATIGTLGSINNVSPTADTLNNTGDVGKILAWTGSLWAPTIPTETAITNISIASTNGFTGTSSGGTTPVITLETTVTGILFGNGTSVSAASAGEFPVLNQNTTGNAATATTAITANSALSANTATTANTATNLANGTTGSIPYQTSSGTTAMLARANGVLIGGTTPSYTTIPALTGTNFTAIPTSALISDSVTIGSTSISLGSSATSLSGLGLVSSTTFVGNLTGTASNNAPLTTGTSILYGNGTGGFNLVTIGSGLTFNSGTLIATGTGGTVTNVAIATTNGFAGIVTNSTTNAVITLETTVTGIMKGNGTLISPASAGTDYSAGTSTLATGILKSTTTTGGLSIAIASDFPTLNQNTTGNAATANTASNIAGGIANEIHYQTGSGITSFITAPISANTYLEWNGSAFVWGTVGTGSLTGVSVATANGFAGTSSGGTTPALTIETTVTGILFGNGTGISAATTGEFPTLNQNTTGTSANVTGIIDVVNGGTGETTNTAAFNALSPITTVGDLIIGNGANSATNLPIGTTGQVLTVNAGTAVWSTPASAVTTCISFVTGAVSLASVGTTNIGLPLPAGSIVTQVMANVNSADTGSGTLAIGISGNTSAFMLTTDNDPTTIGLYISDCLVSETSSVQVIATVAGAPVSGSCTLLVSYSSTGNATTTFISFVTSTVSLATTGITNIGVPIQAGSTILGVTVNITSIDTGTGNLSIGISGTPGAFMLTTENDPTILGLYVSDCLVFEGSSIQIIATVGGSPVSGACTVLVQYAN